MKTTNTIITLVLVLVTTNILAQVGIGTNTPRTTLQIKSKASNITEADGVQVPALTLAELDTKVAAYSTDQDAALIYINDLSTPSSTTETENITAKGFYYFDAPTNKWKAVDTRPTSYSIGDFAQGGIVFWVDETGQHGLVCAKIDQGMSVRWYAGSFGNTQAKGDGPYSGEANTSIIIASQVAIGDDGSTYAARICNELKITEDGITYGDWYLPSKEELNLMYLNKTTIDATANANGGTSFGNGYWSSTEDTNNNAWLQSFVSGVQISLVKSISSDNLRAIRTF